MKRRHALASAVLVTLAGAAPGIGLAQGSDEAQPLREGVGVQVELGSGGTARTSGSGGVDERALRYYASQYDYAKVDAEIARLKELHPDWEPPRDLFGAPQAEESDVDVSGLWAAYDRGDFAAVRSEINALRRINPNWEPPARLLDLMAAAEVRAALKDAIQSGDWAAAIDVGARNPHQIDPAPELIENLWMLAEAHHKSGDDEAAYALYRRVLEESDDAGLRLSTLQKALANRSDERLAALFELERSRSKGEAEETRFAAIERDFKGEGGGDGGPPGPRSRLGMALPRVSSGAADADEIAQVSAAALELRHADAAQVLGWHHFDRGDWAEAERWFARSLDWEPNANAAEGLALTYVEQRRLDEAGELAERWIDRVPALAGVLEQVEQQAVWADAGSRSPRQTLEMTAQAAADGNADPGLLLVRGWALYELGRPSEAKIAFEQAYQDADIEAAQRGDAAYGLALASLELGFAEAARTALGDATMTEAQRRRAEQALAVRDALDAYHAGRYEAALDAVRAARRVAPDDGSLAALEGWSLFELGRYTDAHEVFAELNEAYRSPEAREGLRAIQTRQYPASKYR